MKKAFWIRLESGRITHIAFPEIKEKTKRHYDTIDDEITKASENRIQELISSGSVESEVCFIPDSNMIEIYCRYNREER